ncbi:MAG: nuclear transport factor 2 family protein [Rhodospirillales bacterium]
MSDVAEITELMQTYFDGLFFSDADKLRAAFHASAHLLGVDKGALVDEPAEAWFERVAGRESPSAKGFVQDDAILSLDFNGPDSALAKVKVTVFGVVYVDYLALLRFSEGWRVINKSYACHG